MRWKQLFIVERMAVDVRFTREAFETMVRQLLYQEPVSFDMLCQIAEQTLRPAVKRWCDAEDCLRGRGYEEDILQEIHLRLIKTTVPFFLLRDGVDAPCNNDPEGFERWMYSVAKNVKRDFANRVRKRDFNTENLDDFPCLAAPESDAAEREAYIAQLRKAFNVVLESDVSVYKVLTWLAQCVFILNQDISKIQCNELIIVLFAKNTLNDMYAMIQAASEKIPWIVITEEQNKKILEALRKKTSDGVIYGEVTYESFFMKQNGVISGKKSVSDWMNRMNAMIKRAGVGYVG